MDTSTNHQSQQELIKKIYSFFPKGMYETDKGYYETKEYLKYAQQMHTLPDKRTKWNSLLLDIKNDVPNLSIENWIEKSGIDCGMSAILLITDSNNQEIDLVMNVSILLPYFIFHQSIQTAESKMVHKGSYRDVSFNIPESVRKEYLIICELIKKHFEGYQELEAETAMIELDDVVYEGAGLLNNWESDILKKLTIFNALFTTNHI